MPDEGPLTDYENWMPDFMKGLAKAIEQSRGLIQKTMSNVASDMIISPTAAVNAAYTDSGSSSVGSSSNPQAAQTTGPLIEVREMNVRSDDDIRRISQQLYRQLQQGRRANGYV